MMAKSYFLSNINVTRVLRGLASGAVIWVVFRAVRFFKRYYDYYKFFNNCQGIEDFSWTKGNMHKWPLAFEERAKVEKAWMKAYPKYYRIWLNPLVASLRVYHPDTIRDIIKTAEPKPLGFGNPYTPLLPWLGYGLLVSGGKQWARARRLLTPAFHFDILKPYVTVTNEAVDIMQAKIDKHIEDGTSFEVFSLISLCTFDVLLRCAMSVEESVQEQGNSHHYVSAINELMEIISKKVRVPLYAFDFIFYMSDLGRRFRKSADYVHRFAESIIEKRRETLENYGPPKSRYLDFLDILLNARDSDGKGLTPLEIRNEVDTFLFEGHDTTASGISWTTFTLASRSDIQSRVQEELDELLAGRDSNYINWDDIPKLEYLSRCVKEGMRYHSPVPYVSRKVENEINIDGKVFPEGTLISLGIWNVHHNPDVWEDPEVYDPDRFLPENIKKKDHYAFIPFSAGPRNCIGQHFALNEQKVIIARLLQRYHLEVDKSHRVGRNSLAVMKSTEGLWVYAKRRQ